MSDSPHILLLGGMTHNDRFFDRLLPLLPNTSVVRWAEPYQNESIQRYAERLAKSLQPLERPYVAGVSFGGIVARELAYALDARGCLLISSIRSPAELPPWFRIFRPFAGQRFDSTLDALGRVAGCVPRLVRTRSTTRLTKLADDAGAWHRWATSAVLQWHARPELDRVPLRQIHGDADTTFPIRYTRPDVTIQGGGHVLPFTHPVELAAAIRLCARGLRMSQPIETG